MIRYQVRRKVAVHLAECGHTQSWLAGRLGLSTGFLSQLLRGKKCAGPRVREGLRGLHLYEGWSFDDLFQMEDDLSSSEGLDHSPVRPVVVHDSSIHGP